MIIKLTLYAICKMNNQTCLIKKAKYPILCALWFVIGMFSTIGLQIYYNNCDDKPNIEYGILRYVNKPIDTPNYEDLQFALTFFAFTIFIINIFWLVIDIYKKRINRCFRVKRMFTTWFISSSIYTTYWYIIYLIFGV